MPSGSELAPFVALGALGSLHCAGMCGGFALGVAGDGRARHATRLARLAVYTVGKALAYSAVGLALALGAEGLTRRGAAADAESLRAIQTALAWVAGAVVAACGLSAMGLALPRRRLGPRGTRVLRAVQRLGRGLDELPRPLHGFAVGFATGFLPCGLSWSAFALASQVSPPAAAAGLFLFGLATGPVLVAVGALRWIAPFGLRRLARRLVGPALVGLGLLTVARGGLPGAPTLEERLLPECCAADDARAPAAAPDATREPR